MLPNIYDGAIFEKTVKDFWLFLLYLKLFARVKAKNGNLWMYVF